MRQIYLLLRDHKPHAGAIEVCWRTQHSFAYSLEGDFVWGYFANRDKLVAWVANFNWRGLIPSGIIDIRFGAYEEVDLRAIKMHSPSLQRVMSHIGQAVYPDLGQGGNFGAADAVLPVYSTGAVMAMTLQAGAGEGSRRSRLIQERIDKLNKTAPGGS